MYEQVNYDAHVVYVNEQERIERLYKRFEQEENQEKSEETENE